MRFSLFLRNTIKQTQALLKNDLNIVTEDRYVIHLKAGSGGSGIARYNGIGGKGGDIYFQPKPGIAFEDIKTKLQNNMKIKAAAGDSSQKTKLCALNGVDMVFQIPLGVEIINKNTQVLIARCNRAFEEYLIAKGGEGGSSKNNFKGQKGEEFDIEVHLKLRPNVGLVGFPNAGKSTLLKAFVPRKSIKIAPYPFTTVKPQLAFWSEKCREGNEDDFTLSIADLPGLIEGASKNRGKGYKFLKHLEFCDILLFVIDCTGFQLSGDLKDPYRTPLESISLLVKELEAYDPKMVSKPAVVLINKIDIVKSQEELSELIKILSEPGWEQNVSAELRPANSMIFDRILALSAKSGNVSELKSVISSLYKNMYPYKLPDGSDHSEDKKLL